MEIYNRESFIKWVQELGYQRDNIQPASNEYFSEGDVKLFISRDEPIINLYKKSGNLYYPLVRWASIHENMTDEEMLFSRLGEKRSGIVVKFDELVKVIKGGD